MRIDQKLYFACRKGKTAEAKILVEAGAPLDWQNRVGQTPLHVASSNGGAEIVTLLTRNECNINATDKRGETPLFKAADNNNMTIARELAWSLCDLKIRNVIGETAAQVAKNRGYDALAEYLTNQAPREQVRFVSRAYDAMTHSPDAPIFHLALRICHRRPTCEVARGMWSLPMAPTSPLTH